MSISQESSAQVLIFCFIICKGIFQFFWIRMGRSFDTLRSWPMINSRVPPFFSSDIKNWMYFMRCSCIRKPFWLPNDVSHFSAEFMNDGSGNQVERLCCRSLVTMVKRQLCFEMVAKMSIIMGVEPDRMSYFTKSYTSSNLNSANYWKNKYLWLLCKHWDQELNPFYSSFNSA